jgi:hypothetical protein
MLGKLNTGKLVKKTIVDKNGNKQVVWVNPNKKEIKNVNEKQSLIKTEFTMDSNIDKSKAKKIYNDLLKILSKNEKDIHKVDCTFIYKNAIEEYLQQSKNTSIIFYNHDKMKNGIPPGIVSFKTMGKNDETIYINNLALHPNYIGNDKIKGVGSSLLIGVMRKALKENKTIMLQSTKSSKPFYKKMGFKQNNPPNGEIFVIKPDAIKQLLERKEEIKKAFNLEPDTTFLIKSIVKQHTRKTKSGKLVVVKQYTDKRSKKEKTNKLKFEGDIYSMVEKIKERAELLKKVEHIDDKISQAIVMSYSNFPATAKDSRENLAIFVNNIVPLYKRLGFKEEDTRRFYKLHYMLGDVRNHTNQKILDEEDDLDKKRLGIFKQQKNDKELIWQYAYDTYEKDKDKFVEFIIKTRGTIDIETMLSLYDKNPFVPRKEFKKYSAISNYILDNFDKIIPDEAGEYSSLSIKEKFIKDWKAGSRRPLCILMMDIVKDHIAKTENKIPHYGYNTSTVSIESLVDYLKGTKLYNAIKEAALKTYNQTQEDIKEDVKLASKNNDLVEQLNDLLIEIKLFEKKRSEISLKAFLDVTIPHDERVKMIDGLKFLDKKQKELLRKLAVIKGYEISYADQPLMSVKGIEYKKDKLYLKSPDGTKPIPGQHGMTEIEIESNTMSAVIEALLKDNFITVNGKQYIKLYRGVDKKYNIHSPLESWTTNVETAERFDGAHIFEKLVPIERVYNYHGSSTWFQSQGGVGNQEQEYIVINGGD